MYEKTSFRRLATFVAIALAFLALSATVYLAFQLEKWVILGIALVPILLFISIRNPFFFPFGLYVFFLPFDTLLSVTGNAEGATLTKILGIVTIAILLIRGIMTNKLKIPNFSNISWGLFILYGSLSVAWAVQPDKALSSISTSLGLFLLYLIVSISEISADDLKVIKRTILAGGFVAALMAMYFYSSGVFYKDAANRASLIIGQRAMDPNIFALTLLLPVSIGIEMLVTHSRKLNKLFILIILFTMLAGIVFTGSRGGLLSITLIFVIFAMKSRQKFFISFAILVFILAFGILLPEILTSRWETAVQSGGAGRVSIWHVGIRSLEKFWLLGAGLSNFSEAFNQFAKYAPTYVGLDRAAHSLYLGMLVELGIIGFSLMLIAIFKHYRLIKPRDKSNRDGEIMLKAAFWAMLVSSIFLASYWLKSFWLVWMLITMQRNVWDAKPSASSQHQLVPNLVHVPEPNRLPQYRLQA